MSFKFVILCVLDGWGIAPATAGNAVALSHTPNMNRFTLMYPHTQLGASGEAVGLPRGEEGNTETGHLNLGAGKIVYQDLARINMAIADGSFFLNKTIIQAFDHASKHNSNMHLMGLVGAGGVHSNIEHLYALIQMAKQRNFNRLFLHLFTDGRDSPPTSAALYVRGIRDMLAKQGVGQIASIMGRYWAMDRDQRWDRTQKAYMALTKGEGHKVKTVEEAIELSYQQGKTDEFIEPSVISNPNGEPLAVIGDNDAAIFFNFRIDRPRQLTKAFVFDDFASANMNLGFDPYAIKYAKKHIPEKPAIKVPTFDRGPKLQNLFFVTMTEYSTTITAAGAHAAFPPEVVAMPLGRVISSHDLQQLRVSESEKERFVTFYFNGQQEMVFPGEERLIVPSPKVPTYDKKPEMSANEMTDILLEKLRRDSNYSFILINYANADMVGHTGNLSAAVTACQVVDKCVGKLASFVLAYGGALVITADHGNAEEMVDLTTPEVGTEHSRNPVPFIVIAKELQGKSTMLPSGILADVAPTVLSLLNIEVPTSMMGRNLLTEV